MPSEPAFLLAALLAAHFLGDYTPLASTRMQDAKAVGSPIGPIAAHALIHATLLGLAVALIAQPSVRVVIAAMAIQFWTHLGIDWLRGRLGKTHPDLSDPGRQAFWTALGFDQLLHGLVLVWIVWLVYWLPG
jgi:hypothetical protein